MQFGTQHPFQSEHVNNQHRTFTKITTTETVQLSINQTIDKGNISLQFGALPFAFAEKINNPRAFSVNKMAILLKKRFKGIDASQGTGFLFEFKTQILDKKKPRFSSRLLITTARSKRCGES
ncbi:hypothetical protein [Serratia sp. M24T3]|uniref:hypothetical protein n=1 Tax=Serratia sp. M24T3 TaxID=932213 RepID=UPI00025BBEAF|nr:hypothetical protein [Serratia sp. M24T3]EIC83458.1 hypothetical protein SPM24T3_16433 [Serratia sp. M24T3]